MKNQANVVIHKGCHSRTPLSGIYNARRYQIQENALLNRYVEDPRYQPSGITLHLIPPHPALRATLSLQGRGGARGIIPTGTLGDDELFDMEKKQTREDPQLSSG